MLTRQFIAKSAELFLPSDVAKLSATLFACLMLSACVTRDLYEIEIERRELRLENIRETSAFFEADPQLGRDYAGRIFLAEHELNEYFAGLDGYRFDLDSPRGTEVTIDRVRMNFQDGSTDLFIEASANKGDIRVGLRLVAQMNIRAAPQDGQLRINFNVVSVTPDIEISIFRFREWIFVQILLHVELEKQFRRLPDLEIELRPSFEIDVPGRSRSRSDYGSGWVDYETRTPRLSAEFAYTPIAAVQLDEGLYVYFDVSRIAERVEMVDDAE